MQREDALTIYTDGSTQATGAASARIAIPTNSAGLKPRWIRVAAINESYFRLGDVTVVATANSTLVQPSDSIDWLSVGSATHIAFIQGAAVGRINIIPLDAE